MVPIRFRWRLSEYLAISASDVRRIDDRDQAMALARAILEGEEGREDLRHGGDAPDVLPLAHALERGDIVLVRIDQPPHLLDPPKVHDLVSLADIASSRPLDEPSTTFVDIEVVHESGAIFHGAAFGIQLPDGDLAGGTLDHASRARFDAIPDGGTAWLRFREGALLLDRVQEGATRVEPHPGDIRVALGSTESIRIRTGKRQRIVVEDARAHVLEAEDLCFGFDRSVLLPDAEVRPSHEPGPESADGISVLAKALEFFRENPAKQLLVVGHTDASGSEEHNLQLSEDRALGVRALLLGNHEQWGELASQNHTTADLQRILTWATTTEPLLDCHPGPVDDDLGPLTRDALNRFRKNAGAVTGAPVGHSGSANAADFSAFAAMYDLAICRRLQCGREELSALRSRIRMIAPGACGLGEAYARVHDKASDAERAHDRRVDFLFFDASEARILESGDVASLLYGANAFFRQVAIDVVPRLTADAIGILIVDDDDCPLPSVRYRMTLSNGEVIEGMSDSEGMAYVSSIPSGTCRLELLDVDARDWDAPPVEERPLPPPLPDRVEPEQHEPIEEDIDWSVLDDDDEDHDDVMQGGDDDDPQP